MRASGQLLLWTGLLLAACACSRAPQAAAPLPAEQAAEVCTFIRTTVRHLYGARIARSVTVQYGGSMKPANAAELLSQPDIDGGLIGGASLKAADFVEIVNAANQE